MRIRDEVGEKFIILHKPNVKLRNLYVAFYCHGGEIKEVCG